MKEIVNYFNSKLPELVARCPRCERLFETGKLFWAPSFWIWKLDPVTGDQPTHFEPGWYCRDCHDGTEECDPDYVVREVSLADELVRRGRVENFDLNRKLAERRASA